MSGFRTGWKHASLVAQTSRSTTFTSSSHSKSLARLATRPISTRPLAVLSSLHGSYHSSPFTFSGHHAYTTLSSTSTPSSASSTPSSSTTEKSESVTKYEALHTPDAIASTHFDLSLIQDPQERARILQDFILFPDYLSSKEHDMLMQAATKKLKRALGKEVRYEDGHFDGVITRYRECSASDWASPLPIQDLSPTLAGSGQGERTTAMEVMQSIKTQFFPHHWHWVAPHILELEAIRGGIRPHVDHLDASGEVVAGLCLGSTAVMELLYEGDPKRQFRVLLPKGAFYFQRGHVRYHYEHGIPIPEEDHTFRGTVIPKEKRISVMLRNALEPGFAKSSSSTTMGSMGHRM